MKETEGNIWDYYDKGHWIVITTNGTVKKNGEAVMGRGVALQAKQRLPRLPIELGLKLGLEGNVPAWFIDYHTISFPVKHNWWEKADLDLIALSCKKLVQISHRFVLDTEIYMIRPGCGNGGLDWKDVKPILEKYLDNRFIVVERNR